MERYVRKSILELTPYSSARDEFKGNDAVFLDANENPFGDLNRYPDPYQTRLKSEISKIKEIAPENIFVGNGSDEVIDLSFRIFCEPQKDKALICPPTYGMYEVSAGINNVDLVKVPLKSDFQLNIPEVLKKAKTESVKLIFICSPNNPTGNDLNGIEEILQNFDGMVLIDEAYIDFSKRPSFIKKLNAYPNAIVIQTFSKARALAGARVGMAFASKEVIRIFNRVKPPYNVSLLNQQAALAALQDQKSFDEKLSVILSERTQLISELSKLELVKKIYPTDANFILVEVEKADVIYQLLAEQKIVIRNRNSVIPNTLRITVGTSEENQQLIKALKEL